MQMPHQLVVVLQAVVTMGSRRCLRQIFFLCLDLLVSGAPPAAEGHLPEHCLRPYDAYISDLQYQ